MTIKIALLGTGYDANFKNSLLRLLDIELVQLSVISYSSLIGFGNPEQMPLLFIGNSAGLTSDDLIQLNKNGYILAFPLSSITPINLLTPTTSFSRGTHSYVVNEMSIYANEYFEYMNVPKTTVPVNNSVTSYFLYKHPQLIPILYLGSVDQVRIGVFEKLETNSGILPTPVLYCGFLSTVAPNVNSDLILNDIILFAKNFTNPPYNVSGLVLDFNKEPIDRDIAVYSTTTNKLVGKSRSKEDGTYWVGLSKDEPVYVVAIPEENNNALIKYNIKPVPSY